MDFSKGTFRGQSYSMSFDFFGHIHENGSFIFTDSTALQIGHTALVLVDGEGDPNPNVSDESKEWVFSDLNVLTEYVNILAQNNIELQNRMTTKMLVQIEGNKLKVVIFLALPLKMRPGDEMLGLVRLKYGSDGKVINRVERLLD